MAEASPFLTDKWFELLQEALASEDAEAVSPQVTLVANIEARNSPSGSHALSHQEFRNAHMQWSPGHAPNPDVTFVLDYQTLRDGWLGHAGSTGWDAYQAGKIEVKANSWWVWNDLALLGEALFPADAAAHQRLRAITL
jgi:hypothetical protein